MKAATIARYGSPGVIELRDVPAPAPGPDDVLVRVHAATVNRTDCGDRSGGSRDRSDGRNGPHERRRATAATAATGAAVATGAAAATVEGCCVAHRKK